MRHYLKQGIINLIAFLGALFTLKQLVETLSPVAKSHETLSAVIFIGIFSLFYLCWSLFLQYNWGRKIKYCEVLSIVNDGFAEIHDLKRKNNTSKDDIYSTCKLVCDNLKKAFTIITGTNCSVCIKYITYTGNRPKVETLCRDSESNRKRTEKKNINHWIDSNTDFSTIIKNFESPQSPFFFANKLPLTYDYNNTSFEIYGYPSKNFFKRIYYWPLNYQSTLVVPIRPGKPELSRENNIIGFLCVDSKQMLSFKLKYDLDLLNGVADGLFNTLKKFKELD